MATSSTLRVIHPEIAVTGAAEAPLAVPSSGRAGSARASVCIDRSSGRAEEATASETHESRLRRLFRRKARRRRTGGVAAGWREEAAIRAICRG
jgi:hypothetical protein